MRTVSAPLALGLLAWIAGCSGETSTSGQGGGQASTQAAPLPPATPDGTVLAKVGDGFVTDGEFSSAAARLVAPGGGELPLEDRKAVLDKLITEEALWQEAAARGLYRDPKVRKIMINLLLREEIYANVRASDFTDEELKAYYEAHKDEFVVPEKAQVKRIFIKYGDERSKEEAETLAADIRRQILADPARFKELAEEYSEDPYRRRGGDLGYLNPDGKPGIPPEVVDKAFSLTVGRLSDPFDAGDGINLVMVANRREAVERTFDQMKGSVLRKVKNERYQDLTTEYVDSVRGKLEIDIDEEALAGATIEARAPVNTEIEPPDPEDLLQGRSPRDLPVRRPGTRTGGPPVPPKRPE